MRRILCRNLGCKVNLADAASVLNLLDGDQYELVDDAEVADIVLLNTCVVTHKAERDIRKILGALRRDFPDLPVVLTGCAATIHPTIDNQFPNVRAVIPQGRPESVARVLAGSDGPLATISRQQRSPFQRMGRQRAVVKVQDGCNAHCAYCVVPGIRGPERSLPPGQVTDQILSLLAHGHHELVLSGIHLGRYGADQIPQTTLANLLRLLGRTFERRLASFRIRLSSIEPLEWTQELIDVVSGSRFLCEHFHIPLQSGDDGVLRRMQRPYRLEHFEQVVQTLRSRLPEAALGTDVLVGFPGETEEAFNNTLECVRSLRLSYLHVFTFSPRPGTPAATFPGRIDEKVIRTRAAAIRKVGRQLWQDFLHKGIGRQQQVLIERRTPQGPVGRSRTYQPFRVNHWGGPVGEMVDAVADRQENGVLVGTARS